MGFEYRIEVYSENGEEKKIKGFTDLDFEKLKEIEKICKEYKLTTTNLIEFFIEYINEDSIRQLAETAIT